MALKNTADKIMPLPLDDINNALYNLSFAEQCKVIKNWQANFSDAQAFFSLEQGFDKSSLNKAYRNLAMHFHPDKNPLSKDLAQVAFQFISLAKDYLAYGLLPSSQQAVESSKFLNNPFYKTKTYTKAPDFASWFPNFNNNSNPWSDFMPQRGKTVSEMNMQELRHHTYKMKEEYYKNNKQAYKIPILIKMQVIALIDSNQIQDKYQALKFGITNLYNKYDIPFVEYLLKKIKVSPKQEYDVYNYIEHLIGRNADVECAEFVLSKFHQHLTKMKPAYENYTLAQNVIKAGRVDILQLLEKYYPDFFNLLKNKDHRKEEGLLSGDNNSYYYNSSGQVVGHPSNEINYSLINSVPMVNYLFDNGYLEPVEQAFYYALKNGRLMIAHALLDKNIDFNLSRALWHLVGTLKCNVNANQDAEFKFNPKVILPVGYAQTCNGCKDAIMALMKRLIAKTNIESDELDLVLKRIMVNFTNSYKSEIYPHRMKSYKFSKFDAGISAFLSIAQEYIIDVEIKQQSFLNMWHYYCEDYTAYHKLLTLMPNLANDNSYSQPILFRVLNLYSADKNYRQRDYSWHQKDLINYLLDLYNKEQLNFKVNGFSYTNNECDWDYIPKAYYPYPSEPDLYLNSRNHQQVTREMTALQLCCLKNLSNEALTIIDKTQIDLASFNHRCQIRLLVESEDEHISVKKLPELPYHTLSALDLAVAKGMDEVAAKLINLGVDYQTPAVIYKVEQYYFGYWPDFKKQEINALEQVKLRQMPQTLRALQFRLLVDYIEKRHQEIKYISRIGFGSYTLFGFGFDKDSKLQAANDLLQEMHDTTNHYNHNFSELINATPALQQGRLGKIANLATLANVWECQQQGLESAPSHHQLNNQI